VEKKSETRRKHNARQALVEASFHREDALKRKSGKKKKKAASGSKAHEVLRRYLKKN